VLFHDCGDRVAQLLLLALRPPSVVGPGSRSFPPQQFICVNTHLLFPHNEYSTNIRLRETTKILGFVEAYRQTELCSTICGRADVRLPVIIAGDFNGPPKGQVYRLLCAQNYRPSMAEHLAAKMNISDSRSLGPSDMRWISHVSHRKKAVAVDHVFFLNPSEQVFDRLPPVPDWTNLVFRELRARLTQSANATAASSSTPSLSTRNESDFFREIFAEFDLNGDNYLSMEEFQAALVRLGYSNEGEPALTDKEVEALVATADLDGDGLIDYEEFVSRLAEAGGDLELDSMTSRISARSQWLRELGSGSGPGLAGTSVDMEPPLRMTKLQVARKPMSQSTLTDLATMVEEGAAVSLDLSNARPMGDLRVLSAHLFPRALEEGVWPEDYELSDHGIVSVEFVAQVMGPVSADDVIDPAPYARRREGSD